jgi:hypothetical protein
VSTKLDEMWAALESHTPKRRYATAWRVMLKKQTRDAADAAAWAAADAGAAAWAAAAWAAAWAATAATAADAATADRCAQRAIDAIKREVKP